MHSAMPSHTAEAVWLIYQPEQASVLHTCKQHIQFKCAGSIDFDFTCFVFHFVSFRLIWYTHSQVHYDYCPSGIICRRCYNMFQIATANFFLQTIHFENLDGCRLSERGGLQPFYLHEPKRWLDFPEVEPLFKNPKLFTKKIVLNICLI